jgi:hypothetical protein
MAQEEEVLKTCDGCGATIYPEHLQKHAAELYEDKLLCPHCLKEQKEAEAEPDAAEPDATEVPIALVDEEEVDPSQPSGAIQAFGGGVAAARAAAEREWRRPLLSESRNATRCRTFHCKLSDASFAHLNNQINEWADGDDDIEIKFAVNHIGVVEGKHADAHLIVTVFY